jgi:hypothetical protein
MEVLPSGKGEGGSHPHDSVSETQFPTVAKTSDEILNHCDVLSVKAWNSAPGLNTKTKAVLYERFAEIYHRFWTQGIAKRNAAESAAEPIEQNIPERDQYDGSEEDILEEAELTSEVTPEESAANVAKELEQLNKRTDRLEVRKKLGIDRAFDEGDTKTLPLSQFNRNDDNFRFHRLIMRRSSGTYAGTLKVNDYEGLMRYYLLRNKTKQSFVLPGREEVKILQNEPVSMALLYHMTPYDNSPKAREFFYLAHIASSESLKSNGCGWRLFEHLRDHVVKDTPLFLELDKTKRWKKLRRLYEMWGFHTAKEMRETTNPAWREWHSFMKEASVKGWTAVVRKSKEGAEVHNIFYPSTCKPNNNLWMVYWTAWPKAPLTEAQRTAPYSPDDEEEEEAEVIVMEDEAVEAAAASPMASPASVVAAEPSAVAAAAAEVAEEVEDEEEEEDTAAENEGVLLLPNQLIALPSNAWATLYAQDGRQGRSALRVLNDLVGADGGRGEGTVYTQRSLDKLCARHPQFTVEALVEPFSKAEPNGGLYDYEFRNYILTAPRAGTMDVEPGAQSPNKIQLETGEACAFAVCILLRPAHPDAECPPLWVVESMGIDNKDARDDVKASVPVLLGSMLTLLQNAAASQKMLLLVKTCIQFRREYAWVLRNQGFVFGSPDATMATNLAGSAFANFFDTHWKGDVVQYTANPQAPRARIYTEDGRPSRSDVWAWHWGAQAPIPFTQDFHWPRALQRVKVAAPASSGFILLHHAPQEEQSDLRYRLARTDEWLRDASGVTAEFKIAQLVQMYHRFEIQFLGRQNTRIPKEDFLWDGPKQYLTVNLTYHVEASMFVLLQARTVRAFARVYHFERRDDDSSPYLLPFAFINVAFAQSADALKALFDALQSRMDGCLLITPLRERKEILENHRHGLVAEYQAAGFVEGEGSDLKTERGAQSCVPFLKYLSKAIDTATRVSTKPLLFVDEDPTHEMTKFYWMLRWPTVELGLEEATSRYMDMGKAPEGELMNMRRVMVSAANAGGGGASKKQATVATFSNFDVRLQLATHMALQNAKALRKFQKAMQNPPATSEGDMALKLQTRYVLNPAERAKTLQQSGGVREASAAAAAAAGDDAAAAVDSKEALLALLPTAYQLKYLQWASAEHEKARREAASASEGSAPHKRHYIAADDPSHDGNATAAARTGFQSKRLKKAMRVTDPHLIRLFGEFQAKLTLCASAKGMV